LGVDLEVKTHPARQAFGLQGQRSKLRFLARRTGQRRPLERLASSNMPNPGM
jgi:hypothetical protein